MIKYSRQITLGILLLITASLSVFLYAHEMKRRALKEDLIELSKVKYGLFNVDEWKSILSGIISKKVEELNLEGGNREQMREKISQFLYKVIGDFEARFNQESSQSMRGFLKGAFASMFGVFDNIKRDIPKFTEQILDFLNDPQNRKALKGYVIEKLNSYADNTFSEMDYTIHDAILKKHGFTDRDSAATQLSDQINKSDQQSFPFKIAVLVTSLAVLLLLFIQKQFNKFEYTILVVFSFILLMTGLALPMIEIDARISSMTFTLLGEQVSFKDQVLYYKSKSIIEVVSLMITQSRLDVLVVGVLVFAFSVLFPVSKLISSLLFVFNQELRSNKLINFLTFKTGKWSMADVMVIAIFMSYIGFSGIITEQLRQIENIATTVDILTTNKSNLLTGFFFFTTFAIFSLVLSQRIEQQFKK